MLSEAGIILGLLISSLFAYCAGQDLHRPGRREDAYVAVALWCAVTAITAAVVVVVL